MDFQHPPSLPFCPDTPTILTYINIAVGIDKDVFPVRIKQQVQDVISIKTCHMTPTVWCPNRTSLQISVIRRVYPINESFNFHYLCHCLKNSILSKR